MCTALLCFSVTAAEYMPNFKDTDINEFINIVGKNLERTIIVDPNVRGKISVRSYDMLNEDQYYQFFLNVLQVYDFAVVEMPSGILKVVRSKDAKTSNIPVVEGAKQDGDEFITRVVPVYNVPVRELAPILRQLNDQAGGGNVVSHDPSNVMMLTGRAAVVNRLVEIIERVDRAGDEEVEIVKLRYASASEMVRIIESINKSQGKTNSGTKSEPRVVADDRTNSVIVSGDIKARQRLINLIQRMDQELETNGNTRVLFLNYAKAEDLVKVLQGVSASIQAEEQSGGTTRRTGTNREISIDDTASGWSLPFLGGAKTEAAPPPEPDTGDIEVLTDSEGQEHRFRHYGTLELEGEEYAVMSPVDGDDDVLEVDILHVVPDGGYEAVEDEELFSALAEAAQEHLAA